jgi:WD40 repeat protein
VRYDAFVSYSHAADGRLAPALQRGLEQLARPWYRPRALRVFRDETGLAVNPHLWTSITHALEDSEWFVILCSPEAAGSEWVGREIDHWLACRSAERVLLVLTDGDLVWEAAAGDFNRLRTTAVPPSVFGAFADEPRHLDLRWARDEDQLDLRHGRFRTAVAEVAAPIHGMARDDLESEDVRQHRRTIRLAWAAALLLVFLLMVSMSLGALALRQVSVTRRQAQINLSRQLAAQSLNALHDGQTDLAQLLAVQAIHTRETAAAQASLVQAAMTEPALDRQLHGLPDGPGAVALSSDGSRIAAEGHLFGGIAVWDRRTGRPLARPTNLAAGALAFADGGRYLVSESYGAVQRLQLWDVDAGKAKTLPQIPGLAQFAASADAPVVAALDASGTVSLLDLHTATVRRTVDGAAPGGTISLSPDGTAVAVTTTRGVTPGSTEIQSRTWRAATGAALGPGCTQTVPGTPVNDARADTSQWTGIEQATLLDDDRTVVVTRSTSRPGSDTDTVVVSRCDTTTGSSTASPSRQIPQGLGFSGVSADGQFLASRGLDGTIQLLDVASGRPVGSALHVPITERMELPTVVFSSDGRWFSATASSGDVSVWHTGSQPPMARSFGVPAASSPVLADSAGHLELVTRGGDVLDAETRRRLGHLTPLADPAIAAISRDGHLAAATGPHVLAVADLDHHTVSSLPLQRLACGAQVSAIAIAPDDHSLVVGCTNVGGFPGRSTANGRIQTVELDSHPWRVEAAVDTTVWISDLTYSPDGRTVLVAEGAGAGAGLDIFDVGSTSLRMRQALGGYGNVVAFTPDSRSFFWSHDGRIERVHIEDGRVRRTSFVPATTDVGGGIALANDGTTLAVGEGSNTADSTSAGIRLFDTRTGQPIADLIGSPDAWPSSALVVTDNSLVGIRTSANPSATPFVVRFDLSSDALIHRACGRANRDLTRTEWAQVMGSRPYAPTCTHVH